MPQPARPPDLDTTPAPPVAPSPFPPYVLTPDPDPTRDAGRILTFTIHAGVAPLLAPPEQTAARLARAIACAIIAVRRRPDESPAVIARVTDAIRALEATARAHAVVDAAVERERSQAPASASAPTSPAPNGGPGRPEPRRPRPLDTPPHSPRPVAVIDF